MSEKQILIWIDPQQTEQNLNTTNYFQDLGILVYRCSYQYQLVDLFENHKAEFTNSQAVRVITNRIRFTGEGIEETAEQTIQWIRNNFSTVIPVLVYCRQVALAKYLEEKFEKVIVSSSKSVCQDFGSMCSIEQVKTLNETRSLRISSTNASSSTSPPSSSPPSSPNTSAKPVFSMIASPEPSPRFPPISSTPKLLDARRGSHGSDTPMISVVPSSSSPSLTRSLGGSSNNLSGDSNDLAGRGLAKDTSFSTSSPSLGLSVNSGAKPKKTFSSDIIIPIDKDEAKFELSPEILALPKLIATVNGYRLEDGLSVATDDKEGGSLWNGLSKEKRFQEYEAYLKNMTESQFERHFIGKAHLNWVGKDEKGSGCVLSALKEPEQWNNIEELVASPPKEKVPHYRVVIRTKRAHMNYFIPETVINKFKTGNSTTEGPLLKGIKSVVPELEQYEMTHVKDPTFWQDLLTLEQQMVIRRYKMGILYIAPGQTEEDQFYENNWDQTSEDFKEFCLVLGRKIELKKWKGYKAGLDVTADRTGTHSLYSNYHGMEIMFHLAPFLPRQEGMTQQLERKRHLGNDINVILWKDQIDDSPFLPECIHSHFNHIFTLVTLAPGSTRERPLYRMAVTSKPGVKNHQPPLYCPPIYTAIELREFLLLKAIMAEHAAYSAPGFAQPIQRTRDIQLLALVNKALEGAASPQRAESPRTMTKVFRSISFDTTHNSEPLRDEDLGQLFLAAERGNKTELKRLLRNRNAIEAVDSDGRTPLLIACENGQLETADFLIKRNSDVNAQDSKGWTPLHSAAFRGDIKLCEFLLSRGASAFCVNQDMSTPLHYFMKNSYKDSTEEERVLNLFSQNMRHINIQNKYGESPLHIACFKGSDIAINWLLDRKASCNIRNKHGETPLHIAVRQGREGPTRRLLAAGADVLVSGIEGTPLQIAERSDNPTIIQILQANSAIVSDSGTNDNSGNENGGQSGANENGNVPR